MLWKSRQRLNFFLDFEWWDFVCRSDIVYMSLWNIMFILWWQSEINSSSNRFLIYLLFHFVLIFSIKISLPSPGNLDVEHQFHQKMIRVEGYLKCMLHLHNVAKGTLLIDMTSDWIQKQQYYYVGCFQIV